MKSEETVLILVNKEDFLNLMGALERAYNKGYLPDAMEEEWLEFDYEIQRT